MYAFVSVGQCGGGILDAFFSEKNVWSAARPLAINSATSDLMNLKNIGRDRWLGISKGGFLRGTDKDFNNIIAGGYGQDRDKAEKDSLNHYGKLLEFMADYFLDGQVDAGKVSCAFLLFSLGGGTGSGVGPMVASAFRMLGIPVIAVVVIPAVEEGSLAASNAYVSLKRLSDFANTVILVDNQRIAYTGNMANAYLRYNDYVARGLIELVLGSATEKVDPKAYVGNPPVIDINDIITSTTVKGKNTYACLGRSSEKARGLLNYLFPIGGWKSIDVIKLLYESFLKLSIEGIKPEDSEKNLALLRLPPHYLESEGKLAPVDIIRSFLSERSHMRQTHLGVSVTKRNLVSVVLLFTYLEENVKRIAQLKSQAAHYKQERPKPMSVPRMWLTRIDVSGRGAPVSGAELNIGEETKPDGGIFALEAGRHTVTIRSDSHEQYKGSITVEKHSPISIGLVPKGSKKSVLKVFVKAKNVPVAEAEVIVDDKTARTGADGSAELVVDMGSYRLTVIHPDYRIFEQDVECSAETKEITVRLLGGRGQRR